MVNLFLCTAKEQESMIDTFLKQKRTIFESACKNTRFGFDDTTRLFLKKMHCLTPSSYGTRIQNWFIDKSGMIKVDKKINRGDFKNILEAYFEFKISYKTLANEYSFIQIRPKHEIDGYVLMAVDPDKNYNADYFYLSHKDINAEVLAIGNVIHGGTDLYKIPLVVNSYTYKRWLDTYKISDFKILRSFITNYKVEKQESSLDCV